jgi:hypothetical protein
MESKWFWINFRLFQYLYVEQVVVVLEHEVKFPIVIVLI